MPDATVTMVNGTFLLPPRWEKVAGQTWSTSPYCRVPGPPVFIQPSDYTSFFELARHSLRHQRTGTAWESLSGSKRAASVRLGGRPRGSFPKGSMIGGERASHRAVTANGVGTAAQCRRQQHRQRQHHGLQIRPVAVRGTSELGRA